MEKSLIVSLASFTSFAFGIMNRNRPLKNLYSPLNLNELKLPILIIAPHPDDEWISSAGLIHEVSNRGYSSEIDIVVISNGEAFRRIDQKWKKHNSIPLAEERKLETIEELSFLMNKPANPEFIELRDGTIADAFIHKDKNRLLYNYNIFTNLILRKNYGTYIFPFIFDEHSDHWGASLYTIMALIRLSLKSKREVMNRNHLMYLTHFPKFPLRGTSEKSRIVFPQQGNRENYLEFNLSPENYVAKKLSLNFLKSQNVDLRNSIMLRNFIKKNEPFIRIDLGESSGMHNLGNDNKKPLSEELFNYNFIFSEEGNLTLVDLDDTNSNYENSLSVTFTKIGNFIKVCDLKHSVQKVV